MLKTFVAMAAVALLAQAGAQSMEPSPELKKLSFMLGEWTGKMKWTMEGMPEATADMPLKVEMEGQFYKVSSTMTMSGTKFTETGYTGWDPVKKEYMSWTFTSFAPLPRIERGKLEGDKLVLTSEPWDAGMGSPTISRATLTKITDNIVSLVLEFKEGDKWNKVAEATYNRKAK